MQHAPIIDRETVDMLREMDQIADDGNLLFELVDDFLAHSTPLVDDIVTVAKQHNLVELAAKVHSLKGASLNIGALALFQVCDKIELMARSQQFPDANTQDANTQLAMLTHAFTTTSDALIELRERTQRGEDINDLLS